MTYTKQINASNHINISTAKLNKVFQLVFTAKMYVEIVFIFITQRISTIHPVQQNILLTFIYKVF